VGLRLPGAPGEDDYLGADSLLGSIRLVDIEHTVRPPVPIERYLSRHGAGHQLESPGRECRQDQHVRRGEIRIHRPFAAALAAVVTARPPVEGASQDRKPRGNAGDLQLVGSTLDQELITAGARRREEDAIGMVRKLLGAAEQADQAIYLVV